MEKVDTTPTYISTHRVAVVDVTDLRRLGVLNIRSFGSEITLMF
jgi:hypothetical protein